MPQWQTVDYKTLCNDQLQRFWVLNKNVVKCNHRFYLRKTRNGMKRCARAIATMALKIWDRLLNLAEQSKVREPLNVLHDLFQNTSISDIRTMVPYAFVKKENVPVKTEETIDPVYVTDNDTVRTVLWAIFVNRHVPNRRLLAPRDVDTNHPELLTLHSYLQAFVHRPDYNTLFVAKSTFVSFVHKHWIARPYYVVHSGFYHLQLHRNFASNTHATFYNHMASLMDGNFSLPASNQWHPVQYFHALAVFKGLDCMSMLDARYPHMIPLAPEVLRGELAYFMMVANSWGDCLLDPETIRAAMHYVQTYVTFIQPELDRFNVTKLFHLLREEPGDKQYPLPKFYVTIIRRALVSLVDDTSPLHAAVSKVSHTLMIEQFYVSELRQIFEDDVRSIVFADSAELSVVNTSHDISTARQEVRATWINHAQSPPFFNRLVQLHVELWSPFYNQIIMGL